MSGVLPVAPHHRTETSASWPAGFRARQRGHFPSAVVVQAIASRCRAGLLREVGASSVVHLPCAPASVALARRALSEELRAAGVFDYAVSDAALVISELLSNAILHAYPLPGERLQVAWAVNGSSVEVAVSDGGSATMPHAGHPSLSAVSGRGLSIVAHLCQNWGVRTEEVGLTVWAVLPAPRYDLAAGHGEPVSPVGRRQAADPAGSWRPGPMEMNPSPSMP